MIGPRPIPGGWKSHGEAITLEDGRRAWLKRRHAGPPGRCEIEAAGLARLRALGTLPVPEVYEVGEDTLVMEYVEVASSRNLDARLAEDVAAMHARPWPHFGGGEPMLLGDIVLSNEPSDSWAAFFAERRVRPLLSYIEIETARAIDALCDRMEELVGPPEPPSLLHGNLWNGSVLTDTGGINWLIDPMPFGGHREYDLAIMKKGFTSYTFVHTYAEAARLDAGHEARKHVYWMFYWLASAAALEGPKGGLYTRSAAEQARYVRPA